MGDLSKHFSLSEFSCKCGCGFDSIDIQLIPIAEIVRHHEGGNSIAPSSACRCYEHNETVQKKANKKYISGSSKSKHMPNEKGTGIAMDFKSKNPRKLFAFLDSLFPDLYGMGVYSWGVHIDTRIAAARWFRI